MMDRIPFCSKLPMNEDENMMHCANCGVKENEDLKLRKCACHLVRYCSVKCQKEHRSEHQEACKKQIAAQREELLFKQPESSHFGDCPICFLPLPLDERKSAKMFCCSNKICHGCSYAFQLHSKQHPVCPYCRAKVAMNQEQTITQLKNRIKVNDPVAISQMGSIYFHGGDPKTAKDYWKKASELGDVGAHFELSCLYRDGEGVKKNKKKQMYHLEEAAIGGDPVARNNLAAQFMYTGQDEIAAKHFVIASKLGHSGSLDLLGLLYKKKAVSKEDYAAALRGHQAAVEATKSPQRDVGEASYFNQNPGLITAMDLFSKMGI